MNRVAIEVRVSDLEEFKVFAGRVYQFLASEYARHRDDCNAKGLGCDCGFETTIGQLFESRRALGLTPVMRGRVDNERVTREEAMSDIAHALYRRSGDWDPVMPELWQRSGMTESNWRIRADEFVISIPWLAAYIASLPSEDDGV